MDYLNDTSPKGRVFYVDNLKGFLIFLVVLGHMAELGPANSARGQLLYSAIYAFHMPLFILVSGLFVRPGAHNVRKAFKSLLWPYILMTLAMWILDVFIRQQWTFPQFLKPYYALWYLLALFFWKAAYGPVSRLRHPFLFTLTLSLLGGFVPDGQYWLAIGRILLFWPFFWAGAMLGARKWQPVQHSGFVKLLCAAAAAMTALLVAWVVQVQDLPVLILKMDIAYGSIGFAKGILFRLFYLAAVGLICFLLLHAAPNKPTFVSRIGTQTLSVYLGHLFAMKAFQTLNLFTAGGWKGWLACGICSLAIVLFFACRPVANECSRIISHTYDELVRIFPRLKYSKS